MIKAVICSNCSISFHLQYGTRYFHPSDDTYRSRCHVCKGMINHKVLCLLCLGRFLKRGICEKIECDFIDRILA